MNEQVNFNSMLLIGLGAVIALLSTLWLRSSAAKNSRIDELEKGVEKLKLDSAVIETKVTPLWAKAQKSLSEELHHPHAKDHEMDDLLEKLEGMEITKDETARLKNLLTMRSIDMSPEITSRERLAATVMPFIMDIVLEGDNPNTPPPVIELVLVDPPKASSEQPEE